MSEPDRSDRGERLRARLPTRLPTRLRSRIVWSTALISAVAMTAMIATVVLALSALTRKSIDSTLTDRFSVVAAGVATSTGDPAKALETADDRIDDSTWLYDTSGTEIDGPRVHDAVQRVADDLGGTTRRTRVTRGERVFLAAPVRIGPASRGERGVLIVSQSLEPYEETRTELIVGLALLGLLVTAGATAIAAWTVTRTLEPVDAMAALAEDWSAAELDARFDDTAADDEIAHLGRTLNVLLDRVSGALRSEQRLTSELAHELRTPLTAIRGEAELALMAEPDAATRARLAQVVSLADEMGATVTTLLSIARGEQPAARRTTLTEVLDLATTLGSNPGVELVVPEHAAEVPVAAPTEVAVRALLPLLDNAARYAASRVVVGCSVTARSVLVTVSDDGPGVDAEDPETLFAAGVRGEQSPGAGLGLPLARRAARALGGEVTLSSVREPTTFTLVLPRG